jgi:uncharacterized protein YbjT (DUF2867 family)
MKNHLGTVLVLGASGKTGSRVARRLEDLGVAVRKGSRSGNPPFDWEDESTWDQILQGVHSVYITFQPDLAVPGAEVCIRKFVNHAKKPGMHKLVLLSGRGEPEAQRCEQIVMESGLKWTIVRASWFNQNFSEGYLLDPILAGYVSLPAGDVKEPFVDADDIAEVVVASLTQEGHDGKCYEVTGPHLLTFKEAIAEISRVANRTIEYNQLSLSDYQSMLKEYNVPTAVIDLMSYLFSEVMDGRNASIARGVAEALGREPKDFGEYVSTAADNKVWSVDKN